MTNGLKKLSRAHLAVLALFFGAVLLFVLLVALRVRVSVESSTVIDTPTLSSEEFEALKGELIEMLHERGPRESMRLLARRNIDPRVLRTCHTLAHEVGRAAYRYDGDFARTITGADTLCNSGYLHGVIEEMFGRSPDLAHIQKTLCDGYPEGTFDAWECFHGIGHGLMFALNNDTDRAREECRSHGSAFERDSCLNGVYMEHFGADGKLHVVSLRDPGDPLLICRDVNATESGICHLYAPTYFLNEHPGDYAGATAWCNTAPILWRGRCVSGVGMQMMKEHLDRPHAVVRFCDGLSGSYGGACISGAVSLLVNHEGALEPGVRFCGRDDMPDRESCVATIDLLAPMF